MRRLPCNRETAVLQVFLQHKLHFLEGIGAQTAFRVFKDDETTVLHMMEAGIEYSVGIPVRMEVAPAEQRLAVVFADGFHLATLQYAVVGFEMFQDAFQYMLALAVYSADLEQ